MAKIDDVIKLIEDVDEHCWEEEWETLLTGSIPNWRSILENPDNWDQIEIVRPKKRSCYTGYDHLCKNFLDAGGTELAIRWFSSKVATQKDAAKNWLIDNMNTTTWKKLNDEQKNEFLARLFHKYPSEPFETYRRVIETYKSATIHIRHNDNIRYKDIHRINLPCINLPYVSGYIPDPIIGKIRTIVRNAHDRKYLHEIDEMIYQREKACEKAYKYPIPMQHRVTYSPNKNERELLARLMEKTRSSGYLPAALPSILISDEPPPAFIAYPELEEEIAYPVLEEEEDKHRAGSKRRILRGERRRPETISIEELLGVYQPQHQQVVIYERGIKWNCDKHNFDEGWLFAVVLIHEIGHWITHLLPQPGKPTWPTDLYILGEKDVHEGWAQLITWWIADEVGGEFKRTFEELNKNQPSPYRVFEKFKKERIDTIMASLEKLRLLSWPARLQDWKKAIYG